MMDDRSPVHPSADAGRTRPGEQPDDSYRALFERIPVGIYRTTPDGRMVDANPALVQLAGFPSREEFLATRLDDIWAEPAERIRWREMMERDGIVRDFEFLQRRPDGSVMRVRETARAIRGPDGRVTAYEGIVEDVTERRAAEEKIRLQAEMLEAVGEAVVGTDTAGGITYWNHAAEQIFGWKADEVLGRFIVDVAPGLAVRREALEILRTVASGNSIATEFTARRRDGTEFPILLNLNPLRGADGRPIGTLGVCTDVSRQKREEEAQRFLAEAGSVLASSLDHDTTLAAVARLAVPALADWCFMDVAQDDGSYRRVAMAHVDPEKERLMRAQLQSPPTPGASGITARVIRTGRPWFAPDVTDADLEQLSSSRERRRLLRHLGMCSGIAVPLVAHGRTVGVIRLATGGERRLGPDDLRLAEELGRLTALAVENSRLYRQAQQAVRAREQILRVVSHDLRNPLGAIMAHADMLLSLPDDPAAPGRGWTRIIRSAADHMNRMIRDLIDVANLEAGRLSMEVEPCTPRTLVAEAVAMLRPLASARSLHLSGEAADELPRVAADRERVLQVLSNLVGNALKFSPPGGRIEVRAEVGCGAGREVRFSVTDTGPGIADDELERIFEPFQRGRRASRDGLGLGLSIARRIVEAHHGRIWAENRAGGGSAFHFTLPADAVDGRVAA